jgi:flagellin
MALAVNTNVTSLNALNNLNQTQGRMTNVMSHVSSGLRINRAAEDAAGLGVAESFDSSIRSLTVAARNINDGISVVQTAEGASNEVGNIVKRMRELAVQSSSETLASTERGYIQTEFQQLTSEIDRIAAVTQFNGVPLADGTDTTMDVQVGIGNSTDDRITISLGDLSASTLGVDTGGVNLSTVTGAQAALSTLDAALGSINAYRSAFGAVENRLNSALRNVETYTQSLVSAESSIRDADFAFETAELAKEQILQQAGISVLAQANQVTSGVVRLLG